MGFIDKYIPMIGASVEEAEKKYPGPKLFTSLHSHSIYSQLDGVASPEDYFEGCAYFNMPAFAITDHGTMANLPDSYLSAKKNKIKNISGCELYLNDYHTIVKDKEASGVKIAQIKQDEPELWERYRRNRHLTVLAKNMIGYKNLIQMNGTAWEKFFYYKPRVNMKLLEKHKEGLVVISGCFNGPLSYELRLMLQAREEGNKANEDRYYKNAIKIVKEFYDTFGDDYYLEFQMHGDSLPYGNEIFAETYKIHLATGIKGALTLDCHYYAREDFVLQKTMFAVEQKMVLSDPDLFYTDSKECYFKTRAQLRQTFFEYKYYHIMPAQKFEEFCDNTLEISQKCDPFSPDLSPKLPNIPNADQELVKKVIQGLKNRGEWDNPKKYYCDVKMVTHREQAMVELKRIVDKGFSSYFLITQDIIDYSRLLNYNTGPGRGSAAGSIVAYALGIVDINALKFGLSFDRFLSPSRGGYMLNVKMD